MKTVVSLTLALFTGFAAMGAAAGDDRENLSRCRAAINDAVGPNADTRLYDIRNRRSGDRLRIKVFPAAGDPAAGDPAAGESQMLDCWIYRNGDMSLQTRDGVALGKASRQELEQVTASQ